MAKRGAVEVVYEDELDSHTLDKAITRALKDRPKEPLKIDLNGAKRTAKFLSGMI